MSAWPQVRIGELVDTISNWNPATSGGGAEFEYIDLSAVDQQSKRIISARKTLCAETPSRARQLTKAGDVLVSTVRPNLNAVALVPRNLDGATASTGFCVLRTRPKVVEANFLFHWVRSPTFVAEMVRRATGASYPAISDRIVLESTLALPPLREQRRVAAILDSCDTLRAKRLKALAKLHDLADSIFQDLCGDTSGTRKVDKIVELSDVVTRVTDGVHHKPEYVESGVPFISVKDVVSGTLVFDACKFISEAAHEEYTRRYKPERDDILYTKVGTYGRSAIVATDREFSIYVSVCLIKPRKELVNPVFLNAAMGSRLVKRQADRRIKGIGVPDLHLDQIRQFRIPLPTLEQQRKFSSQLIAVERLRSTQKASLAKLDALFASLQHRAFRGEL